MVKRINTLHTHAIVYTLSSKQYQAHACARSKGVLFYISSYQFYCHVGRVGRQCFLYHSISDIYKLLSLYIG